MMNHKRLFLPISALVWLVVIVSLYYVVHRPFQPSFVFSLVRASWQVILMLGLLVVCGGMGRRLLPQMEAGLLAAAIVQVTLGIGLMALIVLGLGSVWRFDAGIAWGFLTVSITILYHQIWAWLKDVKEGISECKPGSKLESMIAWCCSVMVLLQLMIALAPPIKFDSLTYHLAMPEIYLAAGRISYLPQNAYSGFPQIVHMLYLWMLALGGKRAAVLGWGMGMLALLGVWGLVREKFNHRYAWVTVASLLGGFSLVSALSWGYTDWPSMLAGISFLIVLTTWVEKRDIRMLLWLGVLGGVAVGIKYTNGILVIAGFLVIGWHERQILKAWLKAMMVYCGAAIAVASPWLLRNWLATGNPIYPLLFPAGAIDSVRLELYQDNVVRGSWLDLVFLPFRATIFGLEGAQVGDAPGYTSSIGPLLLGLGALVWLGWRGFTRQQRDAIRTAGWLGLVGLIIWAVGNRLVWHLAQARLYYSVFPSLALIAGVGFAGLERCKLPAVRPGRLAAALVGLVLGFNLIHVSLDVMQKGTLQVITGRMDEQEYLARNLGGYAIAMEEMQTLPEGSLVVMLWEGRGLYCQPLCDSDEMIDRWLSDLRREGQPGEVLAEWERQGYTHVLYYRLGAEFIEENDSRYHESDWKALEQILGGLKLVENANGDYQIYEIGR